MSDERRPGDVTPADEPILDEPIPDEPPPLGTWPRMYALVLGNLAFWIVVFYLFTRAFE